MVMLMPMAVAMAVVRIMAILVMTMTGDGAVELFEMQVLVVFMLILGQSISYDRMEFYDVPWKSSPRRPRWLAKFPPPLWDVHDDHVHGCALVQVNLTFIS